MSSLPTRSPKLGPPSDISQVLSHGPALSASFGRPMGAFLMLVAIIYARRGTFGIVAGVAVAGGIIFQVAKRYGLI